VQRPSVASNTPIAWSATVVEHLHLGHPLAAAYHPRVCANCLPGSFKVSSMALACYEGMAEAEVVGVDAS
jgi:hypothetical protein